MTLNDIRKTATNSKIYIYIYIKKFRNISDAVHGTRITLRNSEIKIAKHFSFPFELSAGMSAADAAIQKIFMDQEL